VLCDVAIEEKDLESLLELRVAQFENLHCVAIVSEFFDLRPLDVDFGKHDSFLLCQGHAKVFHCDETLDQVLEK